MKVYRRDRSRRSRESRHATLTACRTSLDHRDADRAADDAVVRVLNRLRLRPSARQRYATRVAHPRAMREWTGVRRRGARLAVGRCAHLMRSAPVHRS